jgi:hypothetical protein
MRVLISIALATALLVFVAWSRVPGNLPSGFFKMMDRDHDADVIYAEWKAELQAKSDWLQREWDFHSMDCNLDERLTWWEYRRVVFKGGTRCGRNPDISTRPQSAGSFSHCDAGEQIGVQHCVLGSGDVLLDPSVGPMQPLKIPK